MENAYIRNKLEQHTNHMLYMGDHIFQAMGDIIHVLDFKHDM